MARTKQTARKSTGGKAPRQAAVTKFAKRKRADPSAALSNNFPSDDEDNSSEASSLLEEEAPELIHFDVSHETSFYAHYFPTGQTTKTFEPKFSLANCPNPLTQQQETFLAVSFNSKLDGAGMKKFGRPALNLTIALDISGSMGEPFPSETTKSKILVAKECIAALVTKLQPQDRFALILFNTKPTVSQKLTKWGEIDQTKFSKKLHSLKAGGGTEISSAAIAAKKQYEGLSEEPNVSNRVFFFTDMEVDQNDGQNFTDLVAVNASESNWSTVVGIGLDLTSEVITRVSSTPGCNYSNVRSSAYFKEFVETEFDFSVTPTAYGIQVSLESDQVSINKAYGSYELHSVPAGSKKIHFSAEFPSAKNEANETRGGIMLFKLDTESEAKGLKIITSWQNANGIMKDNTQDLTLPEKDTFENLAVRKAIALHYYASFMREYVDCRNDSSSTALKKYAEKRRQLQAMHTFCHQEMKSMPDLRTECTMLEQFAKDDDIPINNPIESLPTSCEPTEALDTPTSDPAPLTSIPDPATASSTPPPTEEQQSLKRKADDKDVPDVEALKALPRSELQTLAKAHGVKANASNAVIIKNLSKLSTSKKPKL